MGIIEILRRIWLFSANKIKSLESFSKQQTQLIIAAHNCHTSLNKMIYILLTFQFVFKTFIKGSKSQRKLLKCLLPAEKVFCPCHSDDRAPREDSTIRQSSHWHLSFAYMQCGLVRVHTLETTLQLKQTTSDFLKTCSFGESDMILRWTHGR